MKSFGEISWSEFPQNYIKTIKQEILSKGKEYILKVDENEFIEYLLEKYKLEPLEIITETESVSEPIVENELTRNGLGYEHVIGVYIFTVSYQFSGHSDLFRVQPTPRIMRSYEIEVDSRASIVSFSFKVYRQDPDEFNQTKSQCYSAAFANLSKLNENVIEFNSSFDQWVRRVFLKVKEKYKSEHDFFAAINVKTNSSTQSIFTAPTLKKKVISQPKTEEGKEYSSVPTMSREMYIDILKVIYDSGKSMEKKPGLYIGKDEEGIRDQFLFILETRYEGTTATGETFNRSGKADIVLKYADDGSNLFIAECKFWHGQAEYLKAISQLFDRYLTWRDSKVAVIMFVDNTDFTNVLKTIKAVTHKHPYFIKSVGERGESSYSYVFHLPQDKNQEVLVEVIAFHFDKKA